MRTKTTYTVKIPTAGLPTNIVLWVLNVTDRQYRSLADARSALERAAKMYGVSGSVCQA